MYLVFEKYCANVWRPVRASLHGEEFCNGYTGAHLNRGSLQSELATKLWKRSKVYEAGSLPADLYFRINADGTGVEYHHVCGHDYALDLKDGNPVLRYWDDASGAWECSKLEGTTVLFA